MDNLRAAFGWSRENSDVELALALACSLQPLWYARGRIREGLAWLDAALSDDNALRPGRTSPRRSGWPGSWAIDGGSARSLPGRRLGKPRLVT